MIEPGDNARGFVHVVVSRLGQLIASGDLAAGDQIMPEQLGEEFGVSRPVVREALRVLEAKGMVRPRPRTGTRVLPIQNWNLLDPDVISWRVTSPDGATQLQELADLRAAVEVYAARMCAEKATPAHVAALRQACERMATSGTAGDPSGFTAADITFHTVILEASGNAVFGQFGGPFAAYLHAREDLHILPEHVAGPVLDTHRRLVDAIERRDPDAAEALSRGLMDLAQREIEEWLPGGSAARKA
jgi:DNA-binding FadR family transcriptional regulator